MEVAIIESPLGKLVLKALDNKLVELTYCKSITKLQRPSSLFLKQVIQEPQAYFQGKLTTFKLPIHLSGTSFQLKVWQALANIPYGKTLSYSELAKQLKTGPRAIGNACRTNPIPIIIPCHRILAKNGLGGYSGQTIGKFIKVKQWLLAHEQTYSPARHR